MILESQSSEADVRQIPAAIWDAHRSLAKWNSGRLNPGLPFQHSSAQYSAQIRSDFEFLQLEEHILQWERKQVREQALQAPREASAFIRWFDHLKEVEPGQNDPLFDWLATTATKEQMRWFIEQEVAGEAGFDDLAALTQLKMPTRPKMEIARNYWDEMGRGIEKGMHGPMLTKVAEELEIKESDQAVVVAESLALGNILLGLAANRRYAYHSVGALGAVELTAPGRSQNVYQGLKRLGQSAQGQRYYLLHATLDVKHSATWNAEVILPLVSENPDLALPIAEGALMRLNAGARCFRRYRAALWAALS